MRDQIFKMLATFFYIGNIPFAPGSMATLAGLLLAVILRTNMQFYILAFVLIALIGFIVSEKIENILKQKDPSCVVIDEVAGILLAFFMLPINWPVLIITFFLFRAFDMFKIYPVNKFEQLHGGIGIMTDDLFAGLYTNITMHIAIRLANGM